MTAKIVLALDASTAAIGWCVGQGERYLNSDTYRPPGECAEARILALARWLVDIVTTYDPDLVAIEKPMGHHGNLRTDRLLARVGGIAEGVCRTMDPPVDVVYIHPIHVKQTPFHKHATLAAANYAGKDSVSGDEADAIGVWHVALGEIRAQAFRNRISEEETS